MLHKSGFFNPTPQIFDIVALSYHISKDKSNPTLIELRKSDNLSEHVKAIESADDDDLGAYWYQDKYY